MKRINRSVDLDLVIGLDCSTTSTKALAVDRNGKTVAYASEPIPLDSPKPNYYEQNATDWWRSCQKVLRELTHQIDPERIKALAISNQRETFVALDDRAKCLRPAIVWLDERCKEEVDPFAVKIGRRRILRITGKPPDYAPVVYRLVWMKKNEPHLFRRIGMVCDVDTFLVWNLTGSFKTSWASADPLGLFDMVNKGWSPLILRALDLKQSQLPETFCPGKVLGRVSPRASELTGLSVNTLIVAGGGDGQAAGLGSNVLTSKRAYLNLGTAVVAGIYGSRYVTDKAFRTMCSCSESGYYYECSLRAGTFAVDWLIRNVMGVEPSSRIRMDLGREARQIPVGSDGLLYLPYLCGVMNPFWDVNARAAFIGLSSFHNRGHFFRSVLEGIAFEQLFAVKCAERTVGTKVNEFVTIGGGAANELWCSILADVTGKRICVPENIEASGLGAAMSAAVGASWYRTFKEAASGMAGTNKEYAPSPQNHKMYSRLFVDYGKIYPMMKKMGVNN